MASAAARSLRCAQLPTGPCNQGCGPAFPRAGWRYSLRVTNRPAVTKGWLRQNAYLDAAYRVHARVEDAVPHRERLRHRQVPVQLAGDEQGLAGRRGPAGLAPPARLVRRLAKAEPKTLRYRILTPPAARCAAAAGVSSRSPLPGPGHLRSWSPGTASAPWLKHLDQHIQHPSDQGRNCGARGTPATRPASRAPFISGP